jgi:hypothetical protein
MDRTPRRESFEEGAHALWGRDDIEAVFPNDTPIAAVPWQQAARSKTHQDYDADLVRKTLSSPPELTDIDPRNLRSTQPKITRAGVDYYMREDYRATGRTFADQHNVGNQFPTVYRRPRMADPSQTEDVLLSGHHRATADLLKGRPTRGRLIEGPWGQPRKKHT